MSVYTTDVGTGSLFLYVDLRTGVHKLGSRARSLSRALTGRSSEPDYKLGGPYSRDTWFPPYSLTINTVGVPSLDALLTCACSGTLAIGS